MKKAIKYFIAFLFGGLLTYFVIQQMNREQSVNASHTIAYGVKKLNKMVVAEQVYANFYSHKSSTKVLGNLFSLDKNILLKVEVEVQASYDLSKMDIKIDSANQFIYLTKVPPLEIKNFPDVEFFELKQSRLNQFTKNEINGIKQRAVKEVSKQIDDSDLRQKAHEQLLENLEELYLLAKIYGWKIKDETPFANELKRRVQF